MAINTAPAPNAPARQTREPARGTPRAVDQETRAPDAPAAPAEPQYTLLSPPSYDNIVGGAPPSPFVSFFMGIGLLILLGAAAAIGFGVNADEWWIVGALFVGVAVLLAGFVSRTA
ncbi:MAG: hypothetical protein HY332_07870 [Chloroflexi bacterium]|nr:hypothetical protein [Chloroflexota bacterium]